MSAANSCRNFGLLLAGLVLATAPATSTSQRPGIAQRLPISLDADSSVFDRRKNQMMFRGLRISQGSIGIEADEAVTTIAGGNKLDFSDSIWKFEGNVRIDIETAKIRSDTAELRFRDHTLNRALVKGDPAKFEDSHGNDGMPVRGEAREFEYDLSNSEIRFAGNARISGGDNEVSGAVLVYDLTTQQVNFQGDADHGERVIITVVPENEKDENPDQ